MKQKGKGKEPGRLRLVLGVVAGGAGCFLCSLGLMALGAVACLQLEWQGEGLWLPISLGGGLLGGWLGARVAGRRALPVALAGGLAGYLLWLGAGSLGGGSLVGEEAIGELFSLALGGALGGIFAARSKKLQK